MNYSPPIGGDFFISFLLWHIGYDDGHDRCGGAVGATVVVGLYVRAWCQSKTNCCISSAMALGAVRLVSVLIRNRRSVLSVWLVGVLIRMLGIGPRSYGTRDGTRCVYISVLRYLVVCDNINMSARVLPMGCENPA